jgi:hypothetical protein
MISSMGKTNAPSLAYRRLLCNLALVALLSPACTLSAQDTPQKSSPPPAAVTTLNPTDLTDFTSLPPLIQTRLTAALALTRLNLTYLPNSHDPKSRGMDCSGAIYHLFQSLGHTDIPRQSDQIAQWLIEKSTLNSVNDSPSLSAPAFDSLKPGDLLFWTTSDAPKARQMPITHVMLYLGTHKTTGKPLLFGSSDGRTYAGQRRTGVSVFDLTLPKATSKSTLHSFGPPPPIPTPKKKRTISK